jgi:hypothetical protein
MSAADIDPPTDSLAGDWHLLDIGADERSIPQHRMDLRFQAQGEQFRGAILHRLTGEEMLLAEAVFDGSELRLQMQPPPHQERASMPWLVMTRNAERFEGYWHLQGEAIGPRLKLVRATA